MADRFMSVPMILSDLERPDARGQNFQEDLLNNARTVSPRTTKFGRITRVGRNVFSEWSATPIAQGGVAPALLNFGGSLLFIHTPFNA